MSKASLKIKLKKAAMVDILYAPTACFFELP